MTNQKRKQILETLEERNSPVLPATEEARSAKNAAASQIKHFLIEHQCTAAGDARYDERLSRLVAATIGYFEAGILSASDLSAINPCLLEIIQKFTAIKERFVLADEVAFCKENGRAARL